MWEPLQEFIADFDDLVGLLTCAGNFPGEPNVLAIAEHSAEGVTGKRSGIGLVPRHDHPCVHTPGQRDSDSFWSREVVFKIARK